MSRRIGIALVLAALVGGLTLTGCAQLVRVESGEVVTCTYGEVTTDTVKVIEVPADQAGNYSVVRTTVICDRHKALEALYAEAQAAIVSDTLDVAKAKLTEILAIDAAFRRAKTQLDAINAGKKPVPDTGSTTPGGSGETSGQVPVGPVANLASYVPDTLTGFTAQGISADAFSLAREYVPVEGSPADYLMIVVEQYRDAAGAQAAIKTQVVPGYGFDVSTVSVAGHALRFGTDNKRFATLAWNADGVMIVIEASSAARNPTDLKSALVTIAGRLVK